MQRSCQMVNSTSKGYRIAKTHWLKVKTVEFQGIEEWNKCFLRTKDWAIKKTATPHLEQKQWAIPHRQVSTKTSLFCLSIIYCEVLTGTDRYLWLTDRLLVCFRTTQFFTVLFFDFRSETVMYCIEEMTVVDSHLRNVILGSKVSPCALWIFISRFDFPLSTVPDMDNIPEATP